MRQGRSIRRVLPLLTLLAMAAFLPVSEIAQIGRQLADTLGATRRIYGLMNEPVPVQRRRGRGDPERQCGAVACAGVDFTYPGQNRRALDDVTLRRFRPARRWRWSARPAPARPRWRSC